MFLITMVTPQGNTFSEAVAGETALQAQRSAEALFSARAIRVERQTDP